MWFGQGALKKLLYAYILLFQFQVCFAYSIPNLRYSGGVGSPSYYTIITYILIHLLFLSMIFFFRRFTVHVWSVL